jgi:hypothetical protein
LNVPAAAQFGFQMQPKFPATPCEYRMMSRRRMQKTGLIIISDSGLKLECKVQDASRAGAALLVSTTFGIPECFDLIIEREHYRCRLQWKTDTTIGVVFQ